MSGPIGDTTAVPAAVDPNACRRSAEFTNLEAAIETARESARCAELDLRRAFGVATRTRKRALALLLGDQIGAQTAIANRLDLVADIVEKEKA